MTEIIFGSSNHRFTNGRSNKSSYNLLKIYPEENKANIAYLGDDSEVPITSTIQYGTEPPKRPPRLKKAKALQNGEASNQDKLLPQISVEEKTIFCCLPKSLVSPRVSPKHKISEDKKEPHHAEKLVELTSEIMKTTYEIE